MFKKLPLILLFTFFAFATYGQTIVSTTPENKNVVLEEFTGIYCVYCPDGHAIAKSIQDANPGRVSLINIHTGGYANPTGSDPDFRTPFGSAIAGQSGLTGYPSGTVNRHVFPGKGMSGGSTAMGRGNWAAAANEILSTPSNVNVGIEATIDIPTRVVTVHVEAYYTSDSPENTNLLNIALLQNNTKGPQTGGGAGNNYNHMHRLVHLITGQWGEVINNTTSGSFVDRTFTYTIPADYNGIPAVLENMELVAFISETQQEIPTGKTVRPFFTGVATANDASIISINPINPRCAESVAPVVKIKNNGQNSLTSLAITCDINGSTQTYNWTGNIPALWDEYVQLGEVSYTLQATNTLSITLPNDDDNSNNTESTTFEQALEGTGTINIEIITDNYGREFSWDLRDSNDLIIDSGSNYGNNKRLKIRLNIAADCYTFNAYDTAGDGGPRVTITDTDGVRLFRIVGNWGAQDTRQFSSNGILSVNQSILENVSIYPNPTQNILNITNAETANIQVYDMLGRSILSKENISLNEQLNVSSLQAGTYFIKITKDGLTATKKFIVAK